METKPEPTSLFIPLVTSDHGSSRSATHAAARRLIDTLLHIEECAKAIAEYKSNGTRRGHKLLDDAAAVKALIHSAPPEIGKQLATIDLNEYELTQDFNKVVRYHFEVDKFGKLTGQPSKRALRLAHRTDAE